MQHRTNPNMRVKDLSAAEQALRNAVSDATKHTFEPQEVCEITLCLKDYGFKIVGIE